MWLRFLYFALALLVLSCGSDGVDSAERDPLTVSAAVSLKDAFGEIAVLYKGRTGRDVTFNFGSSGALQKQIETGAPVDVFASAGVPQMDALAKLDLVHPATRGDLARNRLVVIVPADGRALESLEELTGAEIKRIAAGNPKTVPAGQYTEQALQKAELADKVRSRMVLGEDVRQVLDYVVRGEVDAGFVYATDAKIAGDRVRVAFTVPEWLHAPIVYPIALVKDSKRPDAARQFIELVRGAEGREILKKHGFVTD